MSLPITPTPILVGKEASDFINRVREQENIPAYLVPTPRLHLAVEKIWKGKGVYRRTKWADLI